MNESVTDCRGEIGITVGLVDAIISVCRIIRRRDLSSRDAQESLLDLQADEDLRFLLSFKTDQR